MKKLTKDECMAAVRDGDFPATVLGTAANVAVVMTQSWCPQWSWMRAYLERLPADPEREVFWVEYDREDFFESFMAFKEETFGNRSVPYVRYYRDGALVRSSNFIDEKGFSRILGGS